MQISFAKTNLNNEACLTKSFHQKSNQTVPFSANKNRKKSKYILSVTAT